MRKILLILSGVFALILGALFLGLNEVIAPPDKSGWRLVLWFIPSIICIFYGWWAFSRVFRFRINRTSATASITAAAMSRTDDSD